MTKRPVDIQTWNRKAHFQFFRAFEEPYYGVCVPIDCTIAYRFSKSNKLSFFLYTMFQSLIAAQQLQPFRLRIEGNEVFDYDQIDAGSTIAREDGTFGFGHILYHSELAAFMKIATTEVDRVRGTTDLTRTIAPNVIRYSSLPWINFTSVSHARMFSLPDSCPRISFGKMTEQDGRRSMPISIHVNHALVDGLHVGQYIDLFQQLLNSQ